VTLHYGLPLVLSKTIRFGDNKYNKVLVGNLHEDLGEDSGSWTHDVPP
jgi:hypothetical protein